MKVIGESILGHDWVIHRYRPGSRYTKEWYCKTCSLSAAYFDGDKGRIKAIEHALEDKRLCNKILMERALD